jgi:hypothetical protein
MQGCVCLGRSLLLALLFAVLVPVTAHANSTGIERGGGGCNSGCHGNAPDQGLSVTVSGPATVAPSSTATYTLSIDPHINAGGGFSLSADAGTLLLLPAETNTKFTGTNITHVSAAANLGDWSYNFDLVAPATLGEIVTLSFSGMAYNNDGKATKGPGDGWNVGTYLVEVSNVVVPEPATGLLVSLGISMLALAGCRRKA